ncbi:single-stranded DNA-binding protein [Streptomyces sp. NBC_01180]|uniref:single-stranded DNA-binding protein n=1 Tax=Streptomyces sp. NBC_01180 TaxID=2903763 RepID=UPI00386CF6E9|nr:single-stranded DNA-binding protein [Streptomyces sp. NBC_01180]
MSGETTITLQGNLTADPELRFTPNGHAVAAFSVASTPRTFDKQANAWKDGETLFLRCSAWRSLAENVAESLTRGMSVIVVGRLSQRSYEKDDQKRTVYEVEADNVGPSLARATAAVTKTTGNGAQRQQNAGYAQQNPQGYAQQPEADPWATQQPARHGYGSEPPF